MHPENDPLRSGSVPVPLANRRTMRDQNLFRLPLWLLLASYGCMYLPHRSLRILLKMVIHMHTGGQKQTRHILHPIQYSATGAWRRALSRVSCVHVQQHWNVVERTVPIRSCWYRMSDKHVQQHWNVVERTVPIRSCWYRMSDKDSQERGTIDRGCFPWHISTNFISYPCICCARITSHHYTNTVPYYHLFTRQQYSSAIPYMTIVQWL
jgi:hypothetical protein